MKIGLIILTLNEIDCLRHMLPKLPSPSLESGFDSIYAVDGGSTDGTVEYFKENNIQVVGQSKRGRGQAFHEAFEKIPEMDAFIFFSPDGNEDPKDLPKFKKLLQDGSDIVIASRIMKGAVNEEDGQILKWRKWANIFFNLLANIFFRKDGPYIHDTINGYRAITRKAYQKMALDAQDYTIEYQSTIRAFKNKLKVVEFPTYEGERYAGETGAPSIPTGIRFVKRFFVELFA